MSRIIINNNSDATDERAINLVLGAMKENISPEYNYLVRVTYPSTGEVFQVLLSQTITGTLSFDVRRADGGKP